MVLLQDPVASVRKDSFEGVAALINTIQIYIVKNKEGSIYVIDKINCTLCSTAHYCVNFSSETYSFYIRGRQLESGHNPR